VPGYRQKLYHRLGRRSIARRLNRPPLQTDPVAAPLYCHPDGIIIM
jgi:hypothetical protein